MGIELGSLTTSPTIINGAFQELELRKQLDKFIEKYVLCPKCKLPEIILKVKNNIISCKCDGCGERCPLDNAHKLAKFIVSNPPQEKGIQ